MVTTICQGIGALIAVIGLALMFRKMGIAWWKAFIPVYGEYVLYKKVWNTKMFFATIASTLAVQVTGAIVVACHLEHAAMGMALLGVGAVAGIASLVMLVMLLHRISKAFGHGNGYTAGLFFLAPVFFNVLGLDDSQYQAA